MSAIVWAAFIILTAVEAFIIYRFIRRREKALLKAVIPAYALYAAFVLCAHFLRLRIPDVVMIISMVSLLGHTFLGFYLRLYERAKTFDRFNHALGCFAYAPAFYFTLTSLFNEAIPELLAAILIASLGITLGVFVEIAEFAGDSKRTKNDIKLQRGLKDTDFDLIFDVIGSAAAGIFAYLALF